MSRTERLIEDPDSVLAPDENLILQYWTVVRKRWKLIGLVVLISLAVAGIRSFLAKPTFRASVLLNLERDKGSPLDLESGKIYYYDLYNPDFLPTQSLLIKSREIAERAVQRLDFARAAGSGQGGSAATVKATKAPNVPTEESSSAVVGRARSIQGGISVAPIRGTTLVEISYEAGSPQVAADTANAIAEAYVEWVVESKYRAVGQASRFLTAQIEQLKAEVDEKEKQLQTYGRSKDIVSMDPQTNITLQKLESLNKDYAEATADRISKEAKYFEVQNAKPEALADTASGGFVAQLRNDLLKLERDYAEKLSTFKPEWPAMLQLKAQIEKSRQNLNTVTQETVAKAREAARAEYNTAQRREETFRDTLRSQRSEAMTLNTNAVEYNNLRVEVLTKRTLMDALLKRQSETEVMSRLSGSRESNVRIVDPALPPGARFSPSYRKNARNGVVLGLVLGIGLSFLLEYLDRSLKSPEQVERILHLPALGLIPAVGTSRGPGYGYGLAYGYGRRKVAPSSEGEALPEKFTAELLPHHHPRSAVAESYRALRAGLLLSRAGGVHSFVVTSSFPGEGKTTTAANTAVVLGQLGKRVLLIDGDLHKPRLHEVFKVSNRVGLVSVLAENVEPARAILTTAMPGVSILPSGPISPNPSGLLSSEGMEKLLQLAKANFDFVVIDSPPVQAVADALIMGFQTDGVVLTVKGGVTARDQVARTRDKLKRSNVRILGVLINNLVEPAQGYGASYQYATGAYGYGNEPLEGGSKAPKVAKA